MVKSPRRPLLCRQLLRSLPSSTARHHTTTSQLSGTLSSSPPPTTTAAAAVPSTANTHRFISNRPFSTNPSTKPTSIPQPQAQTSETHLSSVQNPWSGIGRSIISRCSHIWETKPNSLPNNHTLQDLLKMYGDLSPRTIRRYWRASSLKPEEFLQVFAAFGPVVGSRKVEFLFRLFLWASRQGSDFRHLPDSRVAVVSMLTRARRFGDAESLLPSAANESVALHDANLMYSEIIQGYAEACELEKSVALYDRARERGLAPSGECYRALLDLSIKLKSSEVAVRVYRDMLDAGLVCDGRFMEFVVGSLSKDGRTLEAVNVVRRAKSSGIEASSRVLTTIAEGFCRKRDFDDMLSFLEEWKHIPEARICNRIISSLCKHLGDGEAWAFAQRMESFGFELDAVNFGVLVSASCREKQLRAALVYLSECYSRSTIPKLYTYNALISGLFEVGMDKCAKESFENMIGMACQYLQRMLRNGFVPDTFLYTMLVNQFCRKGEIGVALDLVFLMEKELIEPDLSTYVTLISGICRNISRRGRRFERKLICSANIYHLLVPLLVQLGRVGEGA